MDSINIFSNCYIVKATMFNGVREMKYEEYFEEVCSSDMSDWRYEDDIGVYLYRNNIDIIIKNDIKWLENSDDTCYEDWTSIFPNKHAYNKRFILKYREQIIKVVYGVFVDACTCFIPFPDKKMNITKQQYEIGKIINSFITTDEKFDSYLLKAKINIISE